jgi:plasmid stabilization system protein ParE
MFTVSIFSTATADIQDSYDWYEEQSVGLGDRFVNEVDTYIGLISENPFQFAVQFSEKYRFALLKHFPFRIVYRIDEKQNRVYVSAVFHTSRNPKKF